MINNLNINRNFLIIKKIHLIIKTVFMEYLNAGYVRIPVEL